MNIKREPLSDNEGSEEITVRRTKRPKKYIDWGFLKSSRKKRKNPDGSSNDDGISIDLRQGTIATRVDVKQEKQPVDDFRFGKGVQDANVNIGGSYIAPDEHYQFERTDKLETAHSESTKSANSDTESCSSNGEDRVVYQDHCYAACPSKKRKRPAEPKKKSVETANPRSTVDIATLAVYRALIDHTYSSITPSNLIDAVMLKHDYICSIQFQEDFSLRTDYIQEQTCAPEKKPELDSKVYPRSHSKRDTFFFKKGGKHKKVVCPPKRRRNLPEDSPDIVQSLSENPKFRRKNESPKRSPRIKLEKRESSPVIPKVPTKKSGKLQTKKGNISRAKRVEEEESLDSSSVSSKPEEPTKKSKKRRRRNQTGWPTKYKPQPNKSVTTIFKTETNKPKNQSTKKGAKIKKAASMSRDSSPEERVWKNVKVEKDADFKFNSFEGVNVSIEEAVKRRHQRLGEKKGIVPMSPGRKVRERRNVKSVYQRAEDESSQLKKIENGASKRTGKKPKTASSWKANLAGCIKKEPQSSDEDDLTDTDGKTKDKNVSSSGSPQKTRRKISAPTRNRVPKKLEKSSKKPPPSETKGTKNGDRDVVPGDDLPALDSNKSSAVVEDLSSEKSPSEPIVDSLPGICLYFTEPVTDKSKDNEDLLLSSANETITSHTPEAVDSKEKILEGIVSLPGENASSPRSSPTHGSTTETASETTNRSEASSPVSSPNKSVLPSPRTHESLSPSARKSAFPKKPVVSPHRRSKSEGSQRTPRRSPVTPSRKSALSTPKRNENELSSRSSSVKKSRSATPCRSKADTSNRTCVSGKKKIEKNTPKSPTHSSTKGPSTSPFKIEKSKTETKGTDNAPSSGLDVDDPDDTKGSLVPNPKARMSLHRKVKLKMSSLFKPHSASKSKTFQSHPPKLSKIKEEVLDEEHPPPSSYTSAPTDSLGDPTHQLPTVSPKSKRRRKNLHWGHRKPHVTEEAAAKVSPVKGVSHRKTSDELTEKSTEVDDEDRRAELGLAIIKVETMMSDFMHEETFLGESEEPGWGQEDKIIDGSNVGSSTSTQDCRRKSLKGYCPKSQTDRLEKNSELINLACTEEFSLDHDSKGSDVLIDKCDTDSNVMEPEVVYPPLENLDYTDWKNTKTIYTTDVSDDESELEDGCSISEAVDPCKYGSSNECGEPGSRLQSPSPSKCDAVSSSPVEEENNPLVPIPREDQEDALTLIPGEVENPLTTEMVRVVACPSTEATDNRTAVLVKPDHPELVIPTSKDEWNSSSNSDERKELEDDPTSTVLQTNLDARMKHRRDKMRRLRQRRFRLKLLRLRAKRKFLKTRRFYSNVASEMDCNERVNEFDSTSKSSRGKCSSDISSRTPSKDSCNGIEDALLSYNPEYRRVVDLTKTADDSCRTRRAEKKSRRIWRVAPSILRRRRVNAFDSTFKSARVNGSSDQRSHTPSGDSCCGNDDDCLSDRPESLSVLDLPEIPEVPILTHTEASGRILRLGPSIHQRRWVNEFDSISESIRDNNSSDHGACTPSEDSCGGNDDDPIFHRPEFRRAVELTKTPEDSCLARAEKKSGILRVAPSILQQQWVDPDPIPPAVILDGDLGVKEFDPGPISSAVVLGRDLGIEKPAEPPQCVIKTAYPVVNMDEGLPVFPKPVSPQPSSVTAPDEIRAEVIRPVVPQNEPPEPCPVSVIRWRALNGGHQSLPMTSSDAEGMQNQKVGYKSPMLPNVTARETQKLEVDDAQLVAPNPAMAVIGIRKLDELVGRPLVVPKAASFSGTYGDVEGNRKMETVGTRTTTKRENAKRETLQISDEHAYCRKNDWANNNNRSVSDFLHSVRIDEGKVRYIVGERADLVSERMITKNFPLVIKAKSVTVPKIIHFPDDTVGVRSSNGRSFKRNSPDPFDLSGIVAPLSWPPNPKVYTKATLRGYAPGNRGCHGSHKSASRTQKPPADPLIQSIDDESEAVSNTGILDDGGEHDDDDLHQLTAYHPPPEIARLDVLVRKRLALPTDQVSYSIRRDGRPPFSYQTMAAMAIESDPLKSARAMDVLDFMLKHFPFYRSITSKWWKHNIRSMLSSSKILRSDRIGRHVYYSFCKELRLPGDPAIYEMTEEPTEDSDKSEDDEDTRDDYEQNSVSPELDSSYPFGDFLTPQVDFQEPSEPDPLIPVCSYSDDESDGFPVIVNAVTYTGDEFLPHVEPELDDQCWGKTEIKEEPDEGIYCEEASSDTEPTLVERVYPCPYCPAIFDTLQGNLDHSIIHPEVMKPCPQCDFSSPDDVQLMWHINAAHGP